MSILDVIQSEEGSTFVMTEPACGENLPAYKMWKGFTVQKLNNSGAIVVINRAGVEAYVNRQLLNFSGMVIQSRWERI